MPKPTVDILYEVNAARKILSAATKRLAKSLKAFDPEKLPPGQLADFLYDLRSTTKLVPALSAPFDELLDPVVKQVEEHFINTLKVGEASGLQGMRSRVQITDSVLPTVEDWEKFYAHIAKTKSFELLNRAVNREAVRERWEAKKEVPGVGKFIAKKVSCTKLGGRK